MHSCNTKTRRENDEKIDDIVIKLLVRSILYLKINYNISKRILIFIALNRARTFMIKIWHLHNT
jgi:hypothetical protein